MTIDLNTLANFSAASYRNWNELNQASLPSGWEQIDIFPRTGLSDDPDTGFSAAAYRSPDGDIVIAYTGTNVPSFLDNDWLKSNAPAALGLKSPQVEQAAQFYWEVLNTVGLENKHRITFTGHSLGGGLASLMAVYFDLPAVTFDSAPFGHSAVNGESARDADPRGKAMPIRCFAATSRAEAAYA